MQLKGRKTMTASERYANSDENDGAQKPKIKTKREHAELNKTNKGVRGANGLKTKQTECVRRTD